MFFGILGRGLKSGLQTTRTLALIVVPVYLIITLLGKTPALEIIGRIFRPLMEFIGLPGEAVMGVVLGNILNLYAAIGAVTPLQLSSKQITVFALLLLISHSLPIEAAVSRMAGVKAWPFILLRLGVGFLLAAGLNYFWV
ncbi:MAG: nucleoside recognition protein [Deltaproteobacteria bacterium]|nr:nucleoside recognition protein [Candidatus Tharpella sp.]